MTNVATAAGWNLVKPVRRNRISKLPYLAVSQGESFWSKCEFPRVPTFAVSTFTDATRGPGAVLVDE